MSTERETIDPVDKEHLPGDVDLETLAGTPDSTIRIRAIAELNKLEASGMHVVALVEEIDTTPDHVFVTEIEHIHEGDTHFGQDIPNEPEAIFTGDPVDNGMNGTPNTQQATFGSGGYTVARRSESARTSLRRGQLRGKPQSRGRVKPKGR